MRRLAGEEVIAGFAARFYDFIERLGALRGVRRAVRDAVRRVARPPATLVDIGAGTGRTAWELEREGYRVVAVDLSLDMCRIASRRGVDAVQAISYALPIRGGAAAAAYMSLAIHHFADRARALEEALRVVAPGGAVVLVEYNRRRVPVGSHGMTRREMEELVARHGGEVVTRGFLVIGVARK